MNALPSRGVGSIPVRADLKDIWKKAQIGALITGSNLMGGEELLIPFGSCASEVGLG
ncbi:hypothetical protein R6Q59_037002 [Mikania micrantha]